MNGHRRTLWERILDKRRINLFHPESPGVRIEIVRNRFQRWVKNDTFATLGEVIRKNKSKWD